MTIKTNLNSPPGPRGLAQPRLLLAFRRDPAGFLLKLAERYGDVVHFKLGGQPVYLLRHPDDVENVLVTNARNFLKGRRLQATKPLLGEGLLTSEDALHLRQRRLIQPIFHRQHIAGYGQTMVEQAARLSARWRDGETRDLAADMMALTMIIVGKTLFGADVESEAPEIGHAMQTLVDSFTIVAGPFANLAEKLDLPSVRRARQAVDRLNATVYRMIGERRATGDKGDLLSMLLAAQDEDGSGGMTDQQVRDEAMTLFLAGHETTANALMWTWHLLSQNPGAEARLHAELDGVLGGREPTVDDLPRLTYTRRVLSESMRLYPPAWIMGRTAIHPFEAQGYTIPASASIILSQWVMHHNPAYYPDPFKFDPERWTPEAQAARPKFAYFPFGAGPRLCIGEPFAWMEGLLILATLAQHWHMRPVPTHQVKLQPVITLRSKDGMRMTLKRR